MVPPIGRGQQSLVELVEVGVSEEGFFLRLRITRQGESRLFELPIDEVSYRHVRVAMQTRHPSSMPGVVNRYFFTGVCQVVDPPNWYNAEVFVSVGREHQAFWPRLPGNLLRALMWWVELTGFEPTVHHKLLSRQVAG